MPGLAVFLVWWIGKRNQNWRGTYIKTRIPRLGAIPTHARIFAAFGKELRLFQMPRKVIRDHKFAFYGTLGSGMYAWEASAR